MFPPSGRSGGHETYFPFLDSDLLLSRTSVSKFI